MPEEGLKDMFMAVPPFTRYFLTSVLATSFGLTYGMINPYYMLMTDSVIKKLQVWRFLTTFIFAGPFNQGFLFTIIMMYFTCRRIEEYFKGK
jgi:Derlin-2/3